MYYYCAGPGPRRERETRRHNEGRRERGGRSGGSANGNGGLVCDGVLRTLLAFQIYLKGRERRGSGGQPEFCDVSLTCVSHQQRSAQI